MFVEFFNIILKSIKLDKSLYSDKKNYGEASIYYSIIIILLTSLINIVPGSAFLNHMNAIIDINDAKGPSIRFILIISFIVWVIKTAYLYFIGVVIFPSKSTSCSFRKLLIVVAYANSPFIFYILIFDIKLIYFTFIPYIWYCLSLIIGIKIVLKYENYFKSLVITLAPQILFFIWILSQHTNANTGTSI
tara:strand:- start:472 stop:1041 length:570 start_codon:yes stop_codon:yes gene_type:complete